MLTPSSPVGWLDLAYRRQRLSIVGDNPLQPFGTSARGWAFTTSPQMHTTLKVILRAHRQLKDALRSCLAGNKWALHLPWVLQGLRTVPKDDSNISSAELAFGCQVTVPKQFLDAPKSPAAAFMADLQDIQPIPTCQRSYAKVTASLSPALQAAKFVYMYQERRKCTSSLTILQWPFCRSGSRSQNPSLSTSAAGGKLSPSTG